MTQNKKLILALDGLTLMQANNLAEDIADRAYALKIHDLLDREGPTVIGILKEAGARIWADVKLHDIPATVSNRASALCNHGADIITVHASGGVEMMQAAVDTGVEVFAVTILTSLSESACFSIYGSHPQSAVLSLAEDASAAGCAGIVCSPLEVAILAANSKLRGMKFITPGVRSPDTAVDDQMRTNTPIGALKSGATHLVIGRQVTKAKDPIRAFEKLEAEVSAFV